ncbi:hypothetical protein RvY_11794 [Ramazzottius varieornatus]|uniref:Uncharacterized protein n=1 Tax=Ramazzottius varieornatus TaxID=947166 RepID=A0A1D1VH87_RAMVA|nr:hypothetical protein RvY_11794 [Ramazzottius varieornatus]
MDKVILRMRRGEIPSSIEDEGGRRRDGEVETEVFRLLLNDPPKPERTGWHNHTGEGTVVMQLLTLLLVRI